VSVAFRGNGAHQAFKDEPGGHRWQRIPPNERKGRVHTSTVTVSVLEVSDRPTTDVNDDDIELRTTKGSGPGGQHRNKTESCVVAVHRPTGISVKIDSRSQHQNKQLAIATLKARVMEQARQRAGAAVAAERKQQVGSGMRGDKVRTYREQDDQVTDHRTGKKFSLKMWKRGEWSDAKGKGGEV
jgi:peptide chain release factor 1